MPRPAQVSDAIDQYLGHLRARGLARNSIRSHRQALGKALICWGNIQVQNVEPRHIDRLFSENQWGASTRNLYLGYLRQFFAWARHQGYMGRDTDPTHGWRNSRVPRVEKMRLPLEEFPALLDAATHPRDRALLALGLFTFLRGSEIQTLTVGDLDLRHNTLAIFRHKTREEDVLPVSSELSQEMVRWLNWYRQDQEGLNSGWYLIPAKKPDEWVNVDGKLVCVNSLVSVRPERKVTHPYRIPQRALAQLGYDPKGEGEHTLRRSGARALFDTLRSQGYDGALMRVSSMLGHRDTRVTERYIGLTLERTQRNEQFAGQPMFPSLGGRGALRVVENG